MKKSKLLLGTAVIMAGLLLTTGCGKTKLKNGEEVAIKVNGKNITADTLYNELRKKYAKNIIVDDIDKKIFEVMYKDDKDIEDKVKKQIEYIKNQYSDNYEETLKNYGYEDEDELKDQLRLNFQREKAVDDYIKDNITEKELKKYYYEEVDGDISAIHILIKVKSATDSEGLEDEEAKKKAKEIIKKLDDGEDFEKLAKENSNDPGSASNGGDLGYFNKGDMVKEFEEAAYDLRVNEYTKEPVKTSYGYHIILKTGEKEKGKFDKIKKELKDKLVEKKKEEDKTITVTALDEIRKNYKLKFKDSKLKKIYKEYIDEQIEQAEKQGQTNTQ
ncbi:MAG: peptidylprolyl isomerase [Bacilli bacterium]|nr:peptidylprolyl isomerase [Bacilli bacterium]